MRGVFLSQLSHLVRGVRPREMQIEGGLTDRPPMIRVVLSLREDYLGLLDDAAGYLPQILDHRFRLSPLTPDAAAEAIIGPAEIEDACLATRPFRYDREAVEVVLTYLSHRQATKSVPQTRQYIEPFQLQLVCQRVEQIVTERQRVEEGELIITTKDIGGESAIRETLKSFYTRSVGALPRRATRRAIRRLCQEFLISPEGRRLSLEEHEIYRQLQLTPEILQQLVKERLLRS